jgi:hypothetical protein
LGLKVYWAARDWDAVAGGGAGNHHFILISPDDPHVFKRVSVYWGGCARGFTIGWFNKSGRLRIEGNNWANIMSAYECFDPKTYRRWWKSDYSLQLREVSPPAGLADTGLIKLILHYRDHYRANEETKPIKCELTGPNCATGVSLMFKSIGVPETQRDDAGSFRGWDWGEEDDSFTLDYHLLEPAEFSQKYASSRPS